MIEARIYMREQEIGRIRITNLWKNQDGTADYSVDFGVERIGAIGLHTRVLQSFPRLKYNVLGLLLQALQSLDPKELELEQDVSESDLAGEVRGIGSAFSGEEED